MMWDMYNRLISSLQKNCRKILMEKSSCHGDGGGSSHINDLACLGQGNK
jgi:hypothetical protein